MPSSDSLSRLQPASTTVPSDPDGRDSSGDGAAPDLRAPHPSGDAATSRQRQQAGLASPPRLSLCNDVVFKTLFCRYPHLLSDLINAVRHPALPVQVRTILNPHILAHDLAGKHIVLDILAEDDQGQRLGIEMQLQPFRHWPQRNVYGVARSLAAQLQSGQDYRGLKPAIGISLLAHDLFTDHPIKAAWHFMLRDTQYPHVQLGEALQVHIIELHKAHGLRALPAPLRAWIACLLHNLDEAVMTEITHPPVHEALQHLDTLYSDEELRIAAQRREQALIDAEDMLDQARYEGEQKGLQKGEQKGLQKGAAVLLEALLQQKFGPLPDWARLRIDAANEDRLARWAIQILDARHIEDVLGDI